MAEFDQWAKYYDVIHAGLSGELEFYQNLCTKRGGSVLELGSGTGRILLSLANEGMRVTGLDQSPKMLDVCRTKMDRLDGEFPHVQLVEGDMRNFDLDEQFHTIISPYRTFMHIVRPEQQLQCLQSIRKHLEPDGRLFLNVWMPDYGYIHFFKADSGECNFNFIDDYPLDGSLNRLHHYHKVISYPEEQRLVEEHLLIEMDSNKNELERHTLPMTRTWFSVRELTWLVRCAGFEIVHTWGDFEGSPLRADSEESVWELK
jgi:SAM-dependent methyltransferase